MKIAQASYANNNIDFEPEVSESYNLVIICLSLAAVLDTVKK